MMKSELNKPVYLIYVFLLFALLIVSACATLTSDIEVTVQSRPGLNLDEYKTYAWADTAQINFDPVGQWEQPTLDTDDEVRFVINRELHKRGLQQVANDSDLLVSFTAGIVTTTLEQKDDPNSNEKLLQEIPEAALTVVLLDAETGYPVWSGYAVGEVQQQQSIENIRARIDYAITEIFSEF